MSEPQPALLRTRALGVALLVLLCLLAVGRSAVGTRLDSFTIDEPWHVVAGVHHVRANDFRLNPEQPPLVKLWVGALMPDGFKLPAVPVIKEKSNERDFVQETMNRDNDDLAAQARARKAMWGLHGLMLLALGLLCWRALGLAWAAGTLAFLAIEPSIGAHLPVVMMDLGLGLALPIAGLCAGLLFSTWRWRWALALGVAVAVALGVKHSALAGLAGLGLLCLGAALMPARPHWPSRARRLSQVLLSGVLGLVLLWAQYGFHFNARADGTDLFNQSMPDKIAGLQVPRLRALIEVADRMQVLPRSYLWGLADTVRAGVEGRGQSEHLLWGKVYAGAPPWHTWPSVIASKLPLGLMALALLGAIALLRLPLSRDARWASGGVAAVTIAHLAALMSSQATYAGVRHAMPLVVALAILGGAAVAWAWQSRSRPWLALAAASWLIALGMTAREPRLWEYHNELAGGSDRGWDQFGNEGVDLGQRFHEMNAYYQSVIKPTGEPVFYDYGFNRPQSLRAGVPLRRRVESLRDDNVEGIYEGWFLIATQMNKPWTSAGWDPAVGLRGLKRVARFGMVEVWKGRQQLPLARADSMAGRLYDHIYKRGGGNWELVAARADEVMQAMPGHVGIGVELGNARLRLGDRAGAAKAYQALLDQTQRPLDALTRSSLEAQVALLESTPADQPVPLARNPWLE